MGDLFGAPPATFDFSAYEGEGGLASQNPPGQAADDFFAFDAAPAQ